MMRINGFTSSSSTPPSCTASLWCGSNKGHNMPPYHLHWRTTASLPPLPLPPTHRGHRLKQFVVDERLGLVLLLVGLLRGLQKFSFFQGNLDWIPYLIVAIVAVGVVALAAWRISSGPARRRLPKPEVNR